MTNCPHCGSPKVERVMASEDYIYVFDCGYVENGAQPYKCRIRELERTVHEQDKTIGKLSSDYNALVDMHEED